jgi:hypothetical protein
MFVMGDLTRITSFRNNFRLFFMLLHSKHCDQYLRVYGVRLNNSDIIQLMLFHYHIQDRPFFSIINFDYSTVFSHAWFCKTKSWPVIAQWVCWEFLLHQVYKFPKFVASVTRYLTGQFLIHTEVILQRYNGCKVCVASEFSILFNFNRLGAIHPL